MKNKTENKFCPNCGGRAEYLFNNSDCSEMPPMENGQYFCTICREGGYVGKVTFDDLKKLFEDEECGKVSTTLN